MTLHLQTINDGNHKFVITASSLTNITEVMLKPALSTMDA